jgi:hypothetical protein
MSASSGPRWRNVVAIASPVALSEAAVRHRRRSTNPAIPHMPAPVTLQNRSLNFR